MPAVDGYAGKSVQGLIQPITGGEAVTPHNSNEFASVCRALYVGAGGDLVVITPDGTSLTFVGVPTGTILPIRAKRVHATGTTAASILALT